MQAKRVLVFLLFAGTATAQTATEGLGKIQFLGLLAGGSSDGYVELLLRQRGIAFTPDVAYLQTLRAAGAHEFLLVRLREMKPASAPVPDALESRVLEPLARCAERQFKRAPMEAEPFCRSALEADPRNPLLNLVVSTTLLDAKKYDEATAMARRAVELAPALPPAHVVLGRGLKSKGDTDAALSEFREALRLDPKEIDAMVDLGGLFFRDKKDSAAIALYRQALNSQPNSYRAHLALGIALRFTNDFDGAIAEFEQASRLGPLEVAPRLVLGMALHDRKDYDAALAAYRDALRIEPGNARLHAEIGETLMAKGEGDAAIAELREAIRLEATNAMAHAILGAALAQKGDLKSALEEIRVAKERDPDNASYYAQIEAALSSKTTAAAQTAQQQPQNTPAQEQGRERRLPEPHRGSVSGERYKNEFFGFTYELPQGWIARSPEELKKLDENLRHKMMEKYSPKERHFIETGVLTILNHWTLLLASPSTPGAASGRSSPVILLLAEEGNPLQRDPDTYFPYADFLQDRAHHLEGKPTAQTHGGRKFVRADFRVKTPSGKVWETRIVTLAKGYFLVLEIGTEDRQELERLAETANSIAFSTAQE